jgi:hypothetical protein
LWAATETGSAGKEVGAQAALFPSYVPPKRHVPAVPPVALSAANCRQQGCSSNSESDVGHTVSACLNHRVRAQHRQ